MTAPRAVVLGGTGAIGRATAEHLLGLGWRVDVSGRDPQHLPRHLAERGVRFTRIERGTDDEPDRIARLIGAGADLIVDGTCFTARDAARLIAVASHATSTVMLSSKAVYVDALGNHSNSDDDPHFPVPVREDHPTLPAAVGDAVPFDSREGYGAHKVAAENVLLQSGLPITVLRPSKVHGAGSRRPREWVFVKRALDRRESIVLAGRGEAVEHPSAATNIAALIATVATAPGQRILNAADPDAPNVLHISRAVAAAMSHSWREVLIDDPPAQQPMLGATPWTVRHPVVLDTAAAIALGYRPVGDYASTVAAEVGWLLEAARSGREAHLLPSETDEFFTQFLDYAGEDAFLSLG